MTENLPAVYNPAVLSGQMEYAKAMAASDLLPRQYQGKPANLLWAISYGQTLGVAPLTAVQSIHVISGKPTASADLIAGLVRRAGHKLRISGNDRTATAQIIRADDPDFTFEATWTIERAQTAKLTGKDTWKSFPAAMLKARAITEVARAACSEILQGTIYTPEEMGANVGADGEPIEAPVQQLHRVQPGEPDAWTTPQPTAEVGGLSEWKHFLVGADEAVDADAVRVLWQEARNDGAPTNVLNEIAKVGKAKAAAPGPGPTAPAHEDRVRHDGAQGDITDTDDVVQGEVLPEDDYAAAVADLRDAAETARLDMDSFEVDAAKALGMALADAPVDAIRALAATIRPAAA